MQSHTESTSTHSFTQAWEHRHRHTVRLHVKTMQPHTESMSTHSFTQAWEHRHRYTVRQHVKTMQPHTESTSTRSFTQAWAHRHRYTVITCQNNATAYRKYEHTQFHSGMGTQTDSTMSYIFLSLKLSAFRVVPNNINLASHEHAILPSHIVFLHVKT